MRTIIIAALAISTTCALPQKATSAVWGMCIYTSDLNADQRAKVKTRAKIEKLLDGSTFISGTVYNGNSGIILKLMELEITDRGDGDGVPRVYRHAVDISPLTTGNFIISILPGKYDKGLWYARVAKWSGC